MTEPKADATHFREAARALECGYDDERFKERAQKLVKREPVPEKPE